MKKILIILLFLPVIVFGATCEPIKDTQRADRRNLICDAEKRTVTTYKTGNEKVLSNSVCNIVCSEEIIFSVDPIKKVLAGTGFNYPLYASGQRTCEATYNYQQYENKIRALVNEYNSLTGTNKVTKGNEISNYYAQKKACDNFTKDGSEYQSKYSYSGEVSLRVETSTKEITIPYSFVNIDDYDSNVTLEEVNYSSCNYDENGKKCIGSNKTISGWREVVRVFGKYTMKDTYMETYTGEIKNNYSNNVCNAGDRFFTDFTEISRPSNNDITDKGYRLTLTAKKLGHNLRYRSQSNSSSNSLNNNLIVNSRAWELNVNCWYQVKNLIFPQNKPGGPVDDSYTEYGGTAFQYRIIDVNNPFPGRDAGANWLGKEKLITEVNLSTLERFIITLDRSSINKIREYNDVHKYDTFNLDEMEKSHFIEANPNIIDRK